MASMARGKARGDTPIWRRHQPCKLDKHKVAYQTDKGSVQLNGIGYSCQLTAVKRKTRWPVSNDLIAGSGVISEDIIRRRSRARWRPKKIHRSTWVNLSMQLRSLDFDIWDTFHGQLTAVKTRSLLTSITWSGSSVELAKFTCFLSLPLIRLWILVGSQAQVFSQIIKTSQKIEAPLLGLAKSTYYLLVGNWQSLFFSFSSKIFVFSVSVLYTVRLNKSKMVRFMENSFKSGAFSSVIHVYIYKVSHRIRFGLTEKFVKLQFRPLKLWRRLCSRFALGCAEEFWRFSVFMCI